MYQISSLWDKYLLNIVNKKGLMPLSFSEYNKIWRHIQLLVQLDDEIDLKVLRESTIKVIKESNDYFSLLSDEELQQHWEVL